MPYIFLCAPFSLKLTLISSLSFFDGNTRLLSPSCFFLRMENLYLNILKPVLNHVYKKKIFFMSFLIFV
jgi:hypothetical protein